MNLINLRRPTSNSSRRADKMSFIELDDFRQIGIVNKNEIIKSVRGKRFLASLILVILVFALITLLPFVGNKGWDVRTMDSMLSAYFNYVTLFTVLIVGLVGSVALASEFEERTALILFTRPIKKSTIFLGKLLASVILGTLLIVLYYFGVSMMLLGYHGTIPANLFQSFAMCVCYLFAATAISFIFSAVLKKTSVCIIFTILALIVVIPIVSSLIGGDTWYMLSSASDSVLTCIPEYVDSYNKGIDDTISALQSILNALYESTDPAVKEIIPYFELIINSLKESLPHIEYANLARSAGVMLIWGCVSSVIAYILFRRREF